MATTPLYYDQGGTRYVRQYDPNSGQYQYLPMGASPASSPPGAVQGPGLGYYGPSDSFSQNLPVAVPQTTDVIQQFQSALDNLTKQQPQATVAPTVSINPASFNITPMNQLVQKVMNDPNFTKYYDQLLQQAGYDLNEAKRIMEYQYSTGTARATQDAAVNTANTQANLQGALQQLGVTFGQEQKQKLDELNKRGIGLVQSGGPQSAQTAVAGQGAVSYDSQGNPTFTGQEGQAGTELSQLTQDEALRREAQVRTAQQTLQSIGITKERSLQDTGEQYKEAGAKAQSQNVQQTQDIYNQKQQAALQQAQLLQQQQSQAANLELQKAQMQKSGIDFPSSVQSQLSSLSSA